MIEDVFGSRGGKPEVVYDSGRRPAPFIEELLEVWQYRDLVRQWTVRNITLRYKRSALGILWTLLEPLMLTIILTVVFSQLFRFSLESYPIYVLSGLLLFDFFSRSTLQMTEEIIASGNLSQRIHVPRSVFAVASVLSYGAHWLIGLIPLFGIVLVLRHPLSCAIIQLPVALLLTALFALGVGLVVATVGAFFHDFRLAYQVLLTAWLYSTPIIYPEEIIPDQYRAVFKLNPLYHLVHLVRDPVYLGTVAPLASWIIAVGTALATAGAGWWVFTRWRDVFDYRV